MRERGSIVMADYEYDLIVVGAGPAGQKAALQGAKLGRKVAVIERMGTVGGSCVSTGTLPSKTLRETVQYVAGLKTRELGSGPLVQGKPNYLRATMSQLLERKSSVIRHEIEIIQDQLMRNNVDLIFGEASFIDKHMINVQTHDGMSCSYSADYFVIATGSRPSIPFETDLKFPKLIDSDTVFNLDAPPATMIILGAGVIGCEYACIFASLGTRVQLVERRDRLLRFIDSEISDDLLHKMRELDITVRLNEQIIDIAEGEDGRVEVALQSSKVLKADSIFVCMGRKSNVESLYLEEIGIKPTKTGLIEVNDCYQSEVEHVYAAGDVVGFPALASTSMEQGRVATANIFGANVRSFSENFPYGIYTIPEISYVGKNETELTEAKTPYEIGKAAFRETARGQIMGEKDGMLKLLFHPETLDLLGVHIIGEGACELIHIGQAVMAHQGKITYFIDNVFNYPTLAECYKVAALNGVNRL